MRQQAFVALAIIALAFAAIGSTTAHAADVTLTGEVTYRERIALPDAAGLRIRLVDLTRDGTPATIEAEAILPAEGQVPLAFTFNVAESLLTADHRYGLVAEILSGETIFFRNAAPVEVSPLSGEPTVILVQFLGPEGERAASTLDVAASPSVLDVTWDLDLLEGARVDRPVSLAISADLRAGGRAPCNSYFASAELGDGTLTFGAIAATRMACAPEVMSAERVYFGALANVRAYAIDGDTLTLAGETGTPLLVFRRAD